MDDESVNYSRERFDEIKDKMFGLLSRVGIKQEQIKFIPVSALKCDNLVKKSSSFPWWTCEALLEAFEEIKSVKNLSSDKPFRFLVQNVFKRIGIGAINGVCSVRCC